MFLYELHTTRQLKRLLRDFARSSTTRLSTAHHQHSTRLTATPTAQPNLGTHGQSSKAAAGGASDGDQTGKSERSSAQ